MPAERVSRLCPDCSALLSSDNAEIQKTVSESLKKFNKESGLANRFALLQVTRATSGVRAALDAARHFLCATRRGDLRAPQGMFAIFGFFR